MGSSSSGAQDLGDCASTLIGDETMGVKGISGGQRRRVGIGLELVTDPRLVFLDEPTSGALLACHTVPRAHICVTHSARRCPGLDSEMACQVMDSLADLARSDRMVRRKPSVCTAGDVSSRSPPPLQVVCTIHQPNSDITDRFDDIMLLASGRVVYFGRWAHAVQHFSDLGFRCCPGCRIARPRLGPHVPPDADVRSSRTRPTISCTW